MSLIHFTVYEECTTVPLDWWPDKSWLRVPLGMGLFLDHPHLPPYRHHSGVPVSVRWCGLAWQRKLQSIPFFFFFFCMLKMDMGIFWCPLARPDITESKKTVANKLLQSYYRGIMKKFLAQRHASVLLSLHSPWNTACLHMIGQCDIMRPNIILPFLKPNHTTQDIPRMHTDTHVDVNPCGIPHFPVIQKIKQKKIT